MCWVEVRKAFLVLGLILFSPSAHASTRTLGEMVPPSLDCAGILRLVSQIAKLAETLPGGSAAAIARAAEEIPADGIPSWARPLLDLRQKAQPHLDFIEFADSRALGLVTALQLRELGIHSASKASAFLREFPSLPPGRQLSFINGLVFRLLWESLNGLPLEYNQQRLGLAQTEFANLHRFLRDMAPEDYPNFALSLMCHFDFRSEQMAERTAEAWGPTANYLSPAPPPTRRWIKLHGVFIDAEGGQRLYDQKDLSLMLSHLLKLQALEAVGFFLETQTASLSLAELRALHELNLPPDLRTRVEVWVGRQTGLLSLSETERTRQRLINQTQSELQMVESRIRLRGWVNELQGIGDATQLVDTLRLNVDQCMTAMQSQGCAWIQTGIRIVLDYVGLNPGGWSGFLVSSLLSQVMMHSVSSGAGYTGQLTTLLEDMHQRAMPIVAFARGVGTQSATPDDLETLQERKRTLEARLAQLQTPALPAPESI